MRMKPDAQALLATARDLLKNELVTALPANKKYEALMIANALAIAERHMAQGDSPHQEELSRLRQLFPDDPASGPEALLQLNKTLITVLKSGVLCQNPALKSKIYNHLKATALAEVAESNPKFLKTLYQPAKVRTKSRLVKPVRRLSKISTEKSSTLLVGITGVLMEDAPPFDPHCLRKQIFVMRHGAVSYFDAAGAPVRPEAVSLTDQGRQQVVAMARSFAGFPFDRVICSGLPRTQQTAEIILAAPPGGRKPPLVLDTRFQEIRLGRLRNVPPEQFESHIVYGLYAGEGPGGNGSGGEALSAFKARIQAAFCDLVTAEVSPWQSLLLVAHSAVNRALCCWATDSDSLQAFEQDEACVNLIEIDLCKISGKIKRKRLKLVNYTAYDPLKRALPQTELERTFAGYRPQKAVKDEQKQQ